MNKKILIIIIAVLFVVCSVSTFFFVRDKRETEDNEKIYETAAEDFSAVEETTEETTESEVNPYTVTSNSGEAQSNTDSMDSASNPDMVGWIKIDGTNIDYPVMQTKENPDYYLTHDFYKNESVYGCPYVQANCDVNSPSDNVIIYGHHMNDGSMFAGLENFRSKDFWKTHRKISFNTLDTKVSYEILAVFAISVDESDKDAFKFYEFVNAYDSQHFSDFVGKCKSLSFYDTGVTAKYGDKLLTLSTCEYTHENGRLVVVAKRK